MSAWSSRILTDSNRRFLHAISSLEDDVDAMRLVVRDEKGGKVGDALLFGTMKPGLRKTGEIWVFASGDTSPSTQSHLNVEENNMKQPQLNVLLEDESIDIDEFWTDYDADAFWQDTYRYITLRNSLNTLILTILLPLLLLLRSCPIYLMSFAGTPSN